MIYETPKIEIYMFYGEDIITDSIILEKDPIDDGGDIDYDADGV